MRQKLYISEYLGDTNRGKVVVNGLRSLGSVPSNQIEVIEIPNSINSNNEWCRDYMPVKAADNSLVLFKYYPSYLRNSKSGLNSIPDQKKVCKNLKIPFTPCEDIILDGGAIEIYGQSGILSDRLFRDNSEVWKQDEKKLLKKLKDVLGLKKLIVIPQHPYDFTGHVDGLVRFINEKKVIINDLSGEFQIIQGDTNPYRKKLMDQWYYAFKMALYNADLEWHELACIVDKNKPSSDAYGIYMNFLLLERLVIVPGFNNELDETARLQLEEFYRRDAITLQATDLAKQGGIINCVTWAG